MRSGSALLFLFLLFGPTVTEAQPDPDSLPHDTSTLHHHLAPILDDLPSSTEGAARIAEHLATYAEEPLNINRASAADLGVLPGFTPTLARRIVHHREQHGPYEAIAELTAVEGVSTETLHAARPYITVPQEQPSSTSDVSVPSLSTIASDLDLHVIQRVTRRLDVGRGYEEDSTRTTFLGSPGGWTTRLRLSYHRRVELGLTLDHDPGEPFRWAPETRTYGVDHVAGSLVLRDMGPLETLVLGDYTLQFGQGLALWNGMSFGKGRDPITPGLRSGRGIVPFRSAAENQFFRGIAATIRLPGSLSMSAFVSRRARDASLDASGLTQQPTESPLPARTLSSGGYHRTAGELSRKATFGETAVGGAVEYQRPALLAGVTAYRSHFNRPLRPEDAPYRQFRVSGRQTAMISTFANVHLGDYVLFGELARSTSSTYGGVLGTAMDKGETVQALLLGRFYPARFPNLHGSAFGESSGRPQNEMGVYTGLRVRVSERWRIGAYFDQFRFPWLRFTVPRPSRGWDGRLVLEYDPRPWLSSYLQVRAKTREEGTTFPGAGNRQLEGIHPERRQSARWHMEYSFSDALTLRTRIEGARYSTDGESASGLFLSQGVRLQPTASLRIDGRLAFFDTDDYAARIYAYEHDLLYSFSVPVFFDRGRRSYVLVQYEPFSSLVLEAKYGVTRYVNRSTIGSGLNEISGPRRREIGLQIRWHL